MTYYKTQKRPVIINLMIRRGRLLGPQDLARATRGTGTLIHQVEVRVMRRAEVLQKVGGAKETNRGHSVIMGGEKK